MQCVQRVRQLHRLTGLASQRLAAENWRNRRKKAFWALEGILGQFSRLAAYSAKYVCSVCASRVENEFADVYIECKKLKNWQKKVLSDPSEGIFGRFFKTRGFRLSTLLRKLCVQRVRVSGACKIRITGIGILGADAPYIRID